MHKFRLLTVCIVAIASVLLLNNCNAFSINQIDQLKAQFLPAEYRNKNFTLDEVKKVLHEKCKKVSGIDNSTLYQEIEKGATQLMGCLSNVTNITAIQEEIEQARPLGELDTVFHKYCTLTPKLKTCLHDFNTKIQPCLSPAERTQNAAMVRISFSLLDFLCVKGGDQIALFVAEEGPECLEANRDAIANCLNSSFAEFVPKGGNMPDLFNLPELVLQPEHCVDLQRFEKCTLHHLEQCREITPANVAESVFKFIKNETSCKGWMEDKAKERPILRANVARDGASATQAVAAMSVLLSSALLLVLNKILNM